MTKIVIVKKASLPEFLPHGWKTEVAKVLGVHTNTVTNALKAGKGRRYEQIRKIVIEKWGESKDR